MRGGPGRMWGGSGRMMGGPGMMRGGPGRMREEQMVELTLLSGGGGGVF